MTSHAVAARMYLRPGRGWYGDFRSYADVGGRREALVPEGATGATEDQGVAAVLFAHRLEQLRARRRGEVIDGGPSLGPSPTMLEYLPRHVELKSLEVRPATMARDATRIEQVAGWWRNPRLEEIRLRHFNDLKLRLRDRKAQTVNHYVHAVSSLLATAVSDGQLETNVAHGIKRPRVERPEPPFLSSAEGYALLIAAEELDRAPRSEYRGFRPIQALIGTALLAAPRKSELFALLVPDVDFAAGWIHFRPNLIYGRRKSKHAVRRVPLWPQLRALLRPHVGDRTDGLLFALPDGNPVRGVRAAVARVFEHAGIPKPEGREWHLFRHTYTAMRLQTLDQGAPVSPWTVKAELGHGSLALIDQVYGHLPEVRHRLDRVEYRPLGLEKGRKARSA